MCTWNIISLVLYDRQSLHIAKTLQTKKKKKGNNSREQFLSLCWWPTWSVYRVCVYYKYFKNKFYRLCYSDFKSYPWIGKIEKEETVFWKTSAENITRTLSFRSTGNSNPFPPPLSFNSVDGNSFLLLSSLGILYHPTSRHVLASCATHTQDVLNCDQKSCWRADRTCELKTYQPRLCNVRISQKLGLCVSADNRDVCGAAANAIRWRRGAFFFFFFFTRVAAP